MLPTVYLNNRVFLSRNYRLIVAPRKFDVLKTNICPRSKASRVNMLVLRTSNFQGATIRSIVLRHKHYCLYCSPLNFLLRAIEKQSKPTKCRSMKYLSICTAWNCNNSQRTLPKKYGITVRKFTFSRTGTIHSGIFLGRALCADSVSPRTNAIASRDQFKPIWIGENLVVNYNKQLDYELEICISW